MNNRHEELRARLMEVECRGVTMMTGDFPPFWKKAAGSEVWDEEGRRYIDFSSAFGVASIGHSHPEVIAAVRKQSEQLIHGMGDLHPSEPKVILMERLADLFGAPAKVMLCVTGSDAVEAALKTAKLATGRAGVIAFEGAYHGLGYGAMALAGREYFREKFQDQAGIPVHRAVYPSPDRSEESIRQVEAALATGGIGAVIIEPILGRGGIVVPDAGALAKIAMAARNHGALIIFDEIMTGFCRTGDVFAFQHEGIRPDILTVGKAMGGGMPVSAVIASCEIMDAWPKSSGESIHTGTYFGHPLSCAAAVAAIEVMTREKLDRRAAALGEKAMSRVERFGPRGRGLMIGIPCADSVIASRVAAEALKRGLILLVDGDRSDVIEILPPLTIPEGLLDEGLAILESILISCRL